MHLSEHVKLAVLDTQQVIIKYGQHNYLEEAMKSSQPEFYANTSQSSQVLCRKHYISMCLGECPTKLTFYVIKFCHQKYPHPLNPNVLIMHVFKMFLFC